MDILQQGQATQLNCIRHPNYPIENIQTKEIQSDKQLFYCLLCQDEDEEFKQSNYILIRKLLEQYENQIIDKWPPLQDNSLFKKMQKCLIQTNQNPILSSKIESYFENMKKEIVQIIESTKKKMMSYSESFSHYSSNILEKYQEISKIKTLKQILCNQNMDFNQKQNKFRELILDLESQKQKNTETINSILEQNKRQQNSIDFETLDLIKSSIIQLIDSINIFTQDNNIFDQMKNKQQENKNQKNTDLIFDLISTKSNYCSEKFLTSIKSLLNQLSPLIERNTFDEVFIKNKKQIDFSNLNDHYLDIIKEYSQFFQRISHQTEEQMNEMKNIPEIKQIMNVLNLKSNYLKNDYLVQFEKYLIETYPLLCKIKLNTIIKQNDNISVLQEISDETLKNMIELIQKINELYRNGKQAEQTLRIKQKIEGILRQNYYQQEDLDKLFSNYPIFDLLNPLKIIDIVPQMQMIKTNFQQSQQLQIVKNQNNQISISQNIEGSWTNCVSDFILDENSNYVFRFQFINNSQSQKYVMIGLVRDSQKDSTHGYIDYLSCRFIINQNSFYDGSFGIDKKEKGNFSVLRQDQNMIEMRVDIKNEVLQMLDYPNYNHILSITDEYKNRLKEYKNLRLYIGLNSSNINIQIIHFSKNSVNQ